MASVAIQPSIQEIQKQLDYALAAWTEALIVDVEIDRWDLIEQLEYIESWPLQEERLQWLDTQVRAGLMTDEQKRVFAELQEVVKRHRPLIEKMRDKR